MTHPDIKITEIRFRNMDRHNGIRAFFDMELAGQPIKYCKYGITADGRAYVMGPSMKYPDNRKGYFAPVPFRNEIAPQILAAFEAASERTASSNSASGKVTLMRPNPIISRASVHDASGDHPPAIAERY